MKILISLIVCALFLNCFLLLDIYEKLEDLKAHWVIKRTPKTVTAMFANQTEQDVVFVGADIEFEIERDDEILQRGVGNRKAD